ncbi:MAG: SH3 domain-containing protein [Polyangiales bacterium]
MSEPSDRSNREAPSVPTLPTADPALARAPNAPPKSTRPTRPTRGRGEPGPHVLRVRAGADKVGWGVLLAVVAPALFAGLFVERTCARALTFDGTEEANAAASAEPSVGAEPSASEAPSTSPSLIASTSATAAAPTNDAPGYAIVTVGKSSLLGCQDPPGAELQPSKCGDPALDSVVVPKLEALGACAATTSVTGRLSLSLDASFKSQTLRLRAGPRSSISRAGRRDDRAIEPILACARVALADLVKPPADSPPREHGRYLVSYPVTFASPAAATATAPSAVAQEKPASGSATVQVDTAIVRDAPNTSGGPVGRLSRGTKITLVGTVGHWYHVKYGDNEAQDGWIFRSNIGK